MRKFLAGFIILICLSSAVQNVAAQSDEIKPKYLVWEVKVSPAQLGESLKAINAQHEFLKGQNYPYAGFVQYSNDGYLWYSTPIRNYADIDQINETDKKLWEENKEKSEELQKLFEGSYKTVSGMVLVEQPELCVLSQTTEMPTGKRFRYFEKFYIKQGKGQEFEEIVKKYKALRVKHGVTDAFYTFYPAFAPDLSVVYFIDEVGMSPAEHFSENDKIWEKFGAEGEQLWNDVIQVVDKIETHIGQVDYDVSYFPAN